MASQRGVILRDTPGLILVRVDHTVTDSFSRSVDPTATRAWHRSNNVSEHTRHRVAHYAPDWTIRPNKRGKGPDACASFYAFGTSGDAARGALTAYLDGLTPPD